MLGSLTTESLLCILILLAFGNSSNQLGGRGFPAGSIPQCSVEYVSTSIWARNMASLRVECRDIIVRSRNLSTVLFKGEIPRVLAIDGCIRLDMVSLDSGIELNLGGSLDFGPQTH